MGWMEITTAANTTELVRQGRRRELVEQGRIGADAGNAEVRAAERTIRREAAAANHARIAQQEARETAYQVRDDATADPKGMLLFGLFWVALWTVGQVIAQLADSTWWATVTGWGIALAVLLTVVLTVQQVNGRSRHRRRQVS